jgi:hypothetical protein
MREWGWSGSSASTCQTLITGGIGPRPGLWKTKCTSLRTLHLSSSPLLKTAWCPALSYRGIVDEVLINARSGTVSAQIAEFISARSGERKASPKDKVVECSKRFLHTRSPLKALGLASLAFSNTVTEMQVHFSKKSIYWCILGLRGINTPTLPIVHTKDCLDRVSVEA